MTQIKIEIDGKEIETQAGKMLIQVADEAGIHVPRFCYHKKLKVAANCRMCLVEVENVPKTLPACATSVTDGMKVYTQSKKTLESQRAVMEFLLVNHPLDCPICDQGGQCELQDVALGYGQDVSNFTEGKRSVKDENLGPLIATEMTRCIHCTRCVRFGKEVAGIREMGATGRGEHTQIGTYVQHTVSYEMSGNIIDLCPVGALTSKPFRYSARPWELSESASIAPHDCVGSNIAIHTRRQQVMRVVPRENEAINETWISDRDRFSYTGLRVERLAKPMVRDGDQWREVEWNVALNYVADALGKIKAHEGMEKIGALVSPSATCEEVYLLQKMIRGMGGNNIDHRLRQLDFSDQEFDPSYLGLSIDLADIEKQQAILLIGSNITKEQPIVAHRIRKASLNGAEVMSVNMMDYQFNFPVTEKLITVPSQLKVQLGKILKACLEQGANLELQPKTAQWLENYIELDDASIAIAKKLMAAESGVILLGAMAKHYFKSSSLRYLAQQIAQVTGCSLGFLTEGANSAGCYLAGAVPHRAAAGAAVDAPGLTVRQMLKEPLAAYLLHGIEPTLDAANPSLVRETLSHAKFIVAVTAYDSKELRQLAHVMLPMAPFSETSGTYVNLENRGQSFTGAVQPYEQARPAWKIYRVLGNLLQLDGFDHQSSDDVRSELSDLMESMSVRELNYPEPDSIDYQFNEGLELISEVPMYCVDAVVRRSPELQEMLRIENVQALRMCTATAKQLNVQSGEEILLQQINDWQRFQVQVDQRVPEHSVYVCAALESSQLMGDMFGLVKLKNG